LIISRDLVRRVEMPWWNAPMRRTNALSKTGMVRMANVFVGGRLVR
jgi:hypothetical protein